VTKTAPVNHRLIGRYAVVDWVWEQKACSPGAKLTLLALARRANEVMASWPEVGKDLAEATGQGASTIRKHLTGLEELRLIRRINLAWESGGGQSGSLYVINMFDWAEPEISDGALVDKLQEEYRRVSDDPYASILPTHRSVMDPSHVLEPVDNPPVDNPPTSGVSNREGGTTNNDQGDETEHSTYPPPLESRGGPSRFERGALSNRDTQRNSSLELTHKNPPPGLEGEDPEETPSAPEAPGGPGTVTVVEEEESDDQPEDPSTVMARAVLAEVTNGLPQSAKPTNGDGWRLVAATAAKIRSGWSAGALTEALGTGTLHGVTSVYAVLSTRIANLGATPADHTTAPPRPRNRPWCQRCEGRYRRVIDSDTGKLGDICPDCGPLTCP
jgi:hypothetical protein